MSWLGQADLRRDRDLRLDQAEKEDRQARSATDRSLPEDGPLENDPQYDRKVRRAIAKKVILALHADRTSLESTCRLANLIPDGHSDSCR